MNRIYQGRVTCVETLRPGTKGQAAEDWEKLQNWEDRLWEHHQLFQDAVNYYLVALAALGQKPDSPLALLRQRITEVWHTVEKQGQRREGMSESFRRQFGEDAAESFQTASVLAQEGELPDSVEAEKAAHYLLSEATGENGIQQQGPVLWPQFCSPTFSGNFAGGDADARKAQGFHLLSTKLHELSDDTDIKRFAAERQLWEVVKTDPTGAVHSDSRVRLKKSVLHFLKVLDPSLERSGNSGKNDPKTVSFLNARPNALKELQQIDQLISTASNLAPIIKNNRGNSDQIESLLLFKHAPCSFTLDLLRVQFPHRPALEIPPEQDAALNFPQARGSRGYVFRAFTSLVGRDEDSGWNAFDIAAFKEALKVLNQFNQNIRKRTEKLTAIGTRLLIMDGENVIDIYETSGKDAKVRARLQQVWNECGGKPKLPAAEKGADASGEEVPSFDGDPRIRKLKKIVTDQLAEEYRLTEGIPTPYGLRRRTIKGWSEIKRKWRSIAPAGTSFSEKKKQDLQAILNKLRKEKPEQIGSHKLFEALIADEEAWKIWQEPTPEESAILQKKKWAEDPLEAFRIFRELCESLETIEGRELRFTPADGRYSRRLFCFTDACSFGKASGEYKHDPKTTAVTVPLMMRNEADHFEKTTIRLLYSAPRLLRDRIRSDTGEYVQEWIQPMVQALTDGEAALPKQSLSAAAVQLMPDWDRKGNRRILLNFPMDFSTDALSKRIQSQSWEDQFVRWKNGKQLPFLKWHHDFDGKTENRWFQDRNRFSVLAADLGTRQAASVALIEASCTPGNASNARCIGEIGGNTWFARFRSGKVLRLPGENANVVRHRKAQDMIVRAKEEESRAYKDFREELYGSRGRSAYEDESRDCIRILRELGQINILPAHCREESDAAILSKLLSFPEQNDKIIVAIRRTQGRLADLIAIHWRLSNPEKPEQRENALDEWKGQRQYPELTHLADTPEDLTKWIAEQVPHLRDSIRKCLLAVTDRILPLRSRKWEFVPHPDQSHFPDCHLLQQTQKGTDTREKILPGQRGLSIARIEQISELRRRWQSLNQSLRRELGKRPPTAAEMRNTPIPDPCPDLLRKMEDIRKQRVNQTAHLIIAEALGVRLRRPQRSPESRRRSDIHGEYEKIPGRVPVDFIVLEDISRYLTSQGRSKRENSRLMQWCHRQITAKVTELAEPFGIPVLETPAAYSSRFCSQTGVAGFRCVEVSLGDRSQYPWNKLLDEASDPVEKPSEKAIRARELFRKLEEANEGRSGKRVRTLLAPQPGGPIFVTFNAVENPFKGIGSVPPMQADVNAAINLALRAIASPERADIHHRLRTERKTAKAKEDRYLSREKRRFGKTQVEIEIRDGDSLPKERNPNLFFDPDKIAPFDRACLPNDEDDYPYASGRALWREVNDWGKQWNRCMNINDSRISRWEDEDVSYDDPAPPVPEPA